MTFAGALGVPDIRALRPIIPSPGKWRASAHCNPCPSCIREPHGTSVTAGRAGRAPWRPGKGGQRVGLPSVSELVMPTFSGPV